MSVIRTSIIPTGRMSVIDSTVQEGCHLHIGSIYPGKKMLVFAVAYRKEASIRSTLAEKCAAPCKKERKDVCREML
jgi:hypothetical protein